MRIMTYNILDGAAGRREAVVDTIRRADPDVLIINEANGFEANDNQVLHEFSAQIQLPYYHLEKCGDGWIYHVAVFSRSPIVSVKAIHPVARGIVCFTLEHSNGPITVVGLHLSPFSSLRVQELAPVLPIVRQSSRLVVMGDSTHCRPRTSSPSNSLLFWRGFRRNLLSTVRRNTMSTSSCSRRA